MEEIRYHFNNNANVTTCVFTCATCPSGETKLVTVLCEIIVFHVKVPLDYAKVRMTATSLE